MIVHCHHISLIVAYPAARLSVMRLGKKSKDSEAKSQIMDGVTRLICSSKTQNQPLRGR